MESVKEDQQSRDIKGAEVKRKRKNSTREEQREQNKMITLIYHNGVESIECQCGQIIILS